MDMHETTIQAIGAAAVVAGANDAALDEAIDADRTAEAAVLALAIDAARPGLRAITGTIGKSRVWGNGRNGLEPFDDGTAFAEKGTLIAGTRHEVHNTYSDAGKIASTALFLLSDGRLAEVVYDGSWTRWQGASSRWEATMKIVTPREAMDVWDLDKVLSTLLVRVEKAAAGKAPEMTKAALARAEKLRAIVTLAGGSK